MEEKSLLLLLSLLLFSFHLYAGEDWRESAPAEEKIQKLVKVMPGASNLMLQMGDRYRNLYWAARQKKWEFAAYQAEEMEDLIETLQITRPKRAATAREFQKRVYPQIIKAAESGKWQVFESAFSDLRRACMDCHAKNDHAFITLPLKPKSAPSPVLNMQ